VVDSRRKGVENERQLVAWLRAHGYPDARRTLAGDGHQPGDIANVGGLTVEVRAREACKPESWMRDAERQATAEAPLPVVVYHPPGVADPGKWIAMLRLEELLLELDSNGD